MKKDFIVTGTRRMYLGSQYLVGEKLKTYADVAYAITFGGANGVDVSAALSVSRWDERPVMRLVLPANRSQVSRENFFVDWDEVVEMPDGSSYMDRNEMMLNFGNHVIAFPRSGREEVRSGTWATVRRAEKRGYTVDLYPLGTSQIWRLNHS